MTITEFLPYAEIAWLDDVKAIRVKWIIQQMSLSQFQRIVESALDVLKDHKGHIWIADMFESKGVFPKNIMEYISSTEAETKSADAGMSWALTIMPKSVGLATMSTMTWNDEVKKKDTLVMEQFPDLETCKDWIKRVSVKSLS